MTQNTQSYDDARPHTEERIPVPNPDIAPSPKHTYNLINALKHYLYRRDEQTEKVWRRELKNSIWNDTGFAPTGSSNSVWGRQERVAIFNSDSINKDTLYDALRSVGFIVQNPNPRSLRGTEGEGVHVFAPKIERYLPYNTQTMSLPPVDYHIFDYRSRYRDDNITIGIGGTREKLQEIKNDIPLKDARLKFGHIYPDLSVPDITEYLKSNNLSYRVYASYTGRIYREWLPSRPDDQVIFEHPSRNVETVAHSINESNTGSSCGSYTINEHSIDYQDYHIVTTSTAKKHFNAKLCGHTACQKQFDKLSTSPP